MAVEKFPFLRWLFVPYTPQPADREYLERAQTQTQDGIEVKLAVLDVRESRRFFGVNMGRRGIQPVWLQITNNSQSSYRLHLVSLDPNYYSPYEAAAANHFSTGRRLLEYGILAWLFLPLLILLPIKILAAWRANRQMDEFFHEHSFRLRPITPGKQPQGFVFTSLDIGNKIVHVRLLGPKDTRQFTFSVPVPGLAADYLHRDFKDLYPPNRAIDCTADELSQKLAAMPPCTTNAKATRSGDPVNLAVVGDFPTIVSAFGARWDETEIISLATCWKTARAFLTGAEYRYSPVSPLYLFGRSQDFALQRVRQSINERLHLRLWETPLRFRSQPVWVGQISRDVGVRWTWRTWNLTTHRIDPDVDEARDYVVEDLLEAEHLEIAAYVDGVGTCDRNSERKNLTGDGYFTDGKRAVVVLSKSRTAPSFIEWA